MCHLHRLLVLHYFQRNKSQKGINMFHLLMYLMGNRNLQGKDLLGKITLADHRIFLMCILYNLKQMCHMNHFYKCLQGMGLALGCQLGSTFRQGMHIMQHLNFLRHSNSQQCKIWKKWRMLRVRLFGNTSIWTWNESGASSGAIISCGAS